MRTPEVQIEQCCTVAKSVTAYDMLRLEKAARASHDAAVERPEELLGDVRVAKRVHWVCDWVHA
jgi:hypothetical protein